MPRAIQAWADAKGKMHQTLDAATLADLAQIFADGGAEGMSTGLANTVLTKRADIERIFAEYDEAKGAQQ